MNEQGFSNSIFSLYGNVSKSRETFVLRLFLQDSGSVLDAQTA